MIFADSMKLVHADKVIERMYPDWGDVCRVPSRNQKQLVTLLSRGRKRENPGNEAGPVYIADITRRREDINFIF